jgi:sugar phosphate isomerase/epimerase
MKLGLMSAAFPQMSLEELAKWTAGNGFEMLELACWPVGKADRRYAGVTHVDVTSLTAAQAKKIRGVIKKHGLEISSLGYYPNPLHPDLEHRKGVIEHLKKVIVAAEMLKVSIVGTFVGRDKNKTLEENLDEYARVWPAIVRFANDHGVKVAIENCPMIFSNDEWPGGNNLAISPYVWRTMWEIIPDANFGLNLDPSHLIWQMIDVTRVVYEFGPRIFHVHAKDLRIDREQLYQRGILSLGMGWQIPRIPGLGDVNWAQFISALYGAGYDYVISIEHEDRAFEKTEELVKRGFLISRDVLRPYIH